MFFVRFCSFNVARIAVALAVLASTPCAADERIARLEINFACSATLHDFDGNAAPVTLVLPPEPDDADRWSANIEIPVATLDTGNSSRDEAMRKMLDAELFPTIRAVLRNVDPATLRNSRKLPFLLIIRDVEHEKVADVSSWRGDDAEVTFDVSFEISLEQFELEAPGVLFIRVADRVAITVHVTVRRT